MGGSRPVGRGDTDTMGMKRCRVAWVELSMFAKTVLRADVRGLRPGQSFVHARNRLDRWLQGDREGLWREVVAESERRKGKKRNGVTSAKVREESVNRQAGLGRIGRAVVAMVSVGLAADTNKVQQALAAKFPVREFRVTPGGMALPQATGTEVEHFIKQLDTFKAGAGAGPTGLRPQFIKELIGVSGEDPCVDAMHQVAVLFVEGRVPGYLRRWYGGGTLIGIGKDGKPLDEDARPIVIGEFWRRVAGKLTLLKDTETLGGWLRPYQTAVGMKSGAEVICHTLRQWWERNSDNRRYVLLKKIIVMHLTWRNRGLFWM